MAEVAKTVYHVSKRENDGREWKVFIQGSSKVIKLFDINFYLERF